MCQRIKLRVVSWWGLGLRGQEGSRHNHLLARCMATFFAKGVIMLDILPKRITITGVYYANLLDQLRTAIRENAEVNCLNGFCCNWTESPHRQSCNRF